MFDSITEAADDETDAIVKTAVIQLATVHEAIWHSFAKVMVSFQTTRLLTEQERSELSSNIVLF